MTTNYQAALEWRAKGYNTVPRAATDKKHPRVKWKEFQARLVTGIEMTKWRHLFAGGVGFITGEISGVVVIETDGLDGETVLDMFAHLHGPLPDTLVIRSGSHRGFHRHFKHPGHRVTTVANANIKVDVRGDGGFCVLPPSCHKSGGLYEVVHQAEPAELPKGLLEFIETKAAEADGASPYTRDKLIVSDAHPPAHMDVFGDNVTRADLAPPPVETMRAMLQHLAARNYFECRKGVINDAEGRIIGLGWIEAGMALKLAYGDEIGFDLWGETHVDDRARADAPTQWKSFAGSLSP